ncbi:MAG: hypothetical protein ACTSPK_10275, partial [Candidatus Heimdallarchaeota archaeon]
MRTINTTITETYEKRTPLQIIFQIGATFLLAGILCYLIGEIWIVANQFTSPPFTAAIMFFISE